MIDIRHELKTAAKEAIKKSSYPETVFDVEEPKDPKFGDLSANAVLILTRKTKEDPEKIAEKIIKNFPPSDYFSVPEFVSGFLNFRLKALYIYKSLNQVLEEGEDYGKSKRGRNKKVLVEFVSANPTGQLHIGNARGGPIGQTIANLYQNFGFRVDREFYVNDIGTQIEKFAKTLAYYHKLEIDPKTEFPEGGYPGEYMKDVFAEINKEHHNQLKELPEEELTKFMAKEGLRVMLRDMTEDLERLGIKYENWVYESDILCSGKTDRMVKLLEDTGNTSLKEGALWFKNPADPEMTDRETVLRRSDVEKTFTYFANDIAYHLDKFERGYEKAIDVWGANHFGHIPRLNAAMRALSVPEDWLNIVLYQNVRLKNGDEVVQMSKRRGNVVTVSDLEKIGVTGDAFKFQILMHDQNSLIDFDVKQAKDTSEKNPVFYVKYAHARVCSILRKSGKDVDKIKGDNWHLEAPEEKNLAKEITKYPAVLEETFADFKLQRLANYALSLATKFHNFYDKCQVLGEKPEIEKSRLALVKATKIVLRNLLSILDLEAPEKM